MTKLTQALLLLLILLLFTSCEFTNNISTYKDTTEGFVESVLEEEYDKSLTYMATDHQAFDNTNLDTLKLSLVNFRNLIINNFGEALDYKLMTANKTFSTVEGESTAPNTTDAQIQFANETAFGVFEIIFDDHSNKILHIKTLDFKEKIPNMTMFWLFGILALCIPIFNIWMIIKIRRSDLNRKWLKYIAVICLNVPAITYNAVYGLSVNLLSFQILFGISFAYMGFLSSLWTFGIPLGGLYWLWKLSNNKNMDEDIENKIGVE